MFGSPLSLYGAYNYGLLIQQSEYGLGLFGINYYGNWPPPPGPTEIFPPGWLVWGKLSMYGGSDPFNVDGIWQRRHTKTGIRSIKMKWYTPTNPQTDAQQANRQKFADAMAAWGALTSEQKAEYNTRAKRQSLRGWSLFVRTYYELNP